MNEGAILFVLRGEFSGDENGFEAVAITDPLLPVVFTIGHVVNWSIVVAVQGTSLIKNFCPLFCVCTWCFISRRFLTTRGV